MSTKPNSIMPQWRMFGANKDVSFAVGMALVLGLVAAILWALVYYGLLDLSDPKLSTWIGIFALSLVLGVGLSWSIIRRKLSGQVDMDDVEE